MSTPESFTSRLGKATAFPGKPFYERGEELEEERALSRDLQQHKAHVVMLLEQGILSQEVAVPILRELLRLEAGGYSALPYDPNLGLYLSTEKYLVDQLGVDVAGRMHTARSRNDMEHTSLHLHIRDRMEEVVQAIIDLKRVILAKAEDHLETVMPAYTHHSQQAQPTTFAHFLLAGHDAFSRDIRRLEHAYEYVNRSPLGSCAIVTTGFPINRERVAGLLGCDGLVEHSLDASGQVDYLLQTTAAIAICMTNLGQMLESLYLWNTAEFGMVELADEYCSISSIMPQKKNPVAMEMIRGEAVLVSNHLNAMLTVLKAIPSGGGREWMYTSRLFPRCVNSAVGSLTTMAGIIETLTVNREVMARRALEGYSTVTELTDEIVRSRDLSFRQSHHIVGMVVRNAIQAGLMANEITGAMIDEAAIEVMGRPLNLAEEVVAKALDPMENVRVRDVTGGPAPVEVQRMIAARWETLRADEERLAARKAKLARAAATLQARIDEILGS